MISDEENTRYCKLLSYVLQHKPHHLGIHLDVNGWTDVKNLLIQFSEKEETIDFQTLKYIVETDKKKRFIFNKDFSQIKASEEQLPEPDAELLQPPPDYLYHATAERFLESILLIGLKKMHRSYVQLSADIETARIAGQRHGAPVILKINSLAMISAQHYFYLSGNGTWLTETVPPEFITVEKRKLIYFQEVIK